MNASATPAAPDLRPRSAITRTMLIVMMSGLALAACQKAEEPTPKPITGATAAPASSSSPTTPQTPAGAAATLPSHDVKAPSEGAATQSGSNQTPAQAQSSDGKTEALSPKEESTEMPKAGHGNNHSTPDTQKPADSDKPAAGAK